MSEKHMKIEGEEYPLAFNMNTIRAFARHKGFDTINQFNDWMKVIAEQKDNISFTLYDDLAYMALCAVKEGARLAKKDWPEFTIEDFNLVIEQQADVLLSAFTDTLPGEEDFDEKDSKKKEPDKNQK